MGEVTQTVRGYIDRFLAKEKLNERSFFARPETRQTMEAILVAALQKNTSSELLANPASVCNISPKEEERKKKPFSN